MADTSPLIVGDPPQLGEYRLVGRIGEGGQGVVYLGRHPDGREVAVKLLRAQFSGDSEARSRFTRELEVIERIAGFCTAQVIDSDVAGDTPYIVSEYVRGPSLQELVETQGPRTGTDFERLAVGTITALTSIHQAGVVHRDFKPPNVLMGADGPRVIDFGIARALDSGATIASGVVGTPAYMAPEQLSGDRVDTPVDLFAWGATMVFAATGRKPFDGETVPRVIAQVLHEEPNLAGVPQHFQQLLAACMAKDASARPTAQEALLYLLGSTGKARPSGANPAQLLSDGAAVSQPGNGSQPGSGSQPGGGSQPGSGSLQGGGSRPGNGSPGLVDTTRPPGGQGYQGPPGQYSPQAQHPQQQYAANQQPQAYAPNQQPQTIQGAPPKRKRPVPAIALAAAAVVVIAGVGGAAAIMSSSGGKPKPHTSAQSGNSANPGSNGIQPAAPPPDAVTALGTAKSSTVTVLSYNYQNLEGSQASADPLLTPAFKNTYDQALAQNKPRYLKDKTVMQARVRYGGLISYTTGTALVLAYVDRTQTKAGKVTNLTDSFRVTMKASGSQWLIDNLDAVTQGSTPTDTTSAQWPGTGGHQLIKAAEDCVTSTGTFTYQNLQALTDAVNKCGTGQFLRYYHDNQSSIQQRLTDQKAVAKTVIVEAAVEPITQSDQATVLLTTYGTKQATPPKAPIFQTEEVTMQVADGTWKLENDVESAGNSQ